MFFKWIRFNHYKINYRLHVPRLQHLSGLEKNDEGRSCVWAAGLILRNPDCARCHSGPWKWHRKDSCRCIRHSPGRVVRRSRQHRSGHAPTQAPQPLQASSSTKATAEPLSVQFVSLVRLLSRFVKVVLILSGEIAGVTKVSAYRIG